MESWMPHTNALTFADARAAAHPEMFMPTDVARLDWAALLELSRCAPVSEGYRLVPLQRSQVRAVVALVARWFPDVSVGSASSYLDERFYQQRVWFADGPQRDVVVMALCRREELVGMFSFEVDLQALTIHARIGVAAAAHRGANLARAGMALSEAVGRWMGMGLVYGMATLKSPYSQLAFERAGWQLIGITPGLDREMVEPGVVKRVYEAMYVKALVADGELQRPHAGNMTPRTQTLYRQLFDRAGAAQIGGHAAD